MKKLHCLSFILLLIACFPPVPAFSHGNSNITGSYITIKYQPSISNFRNFHIKETDFDTKNPIGLTTYAKNSQSNILFNYNFYLPRQSDSYKSYGNDLLGFGMSIGLLVRNLRIEFEGSYNKFDVKPLIGYAYKDGHRYFAIPREKTNNGLAPTSSLIFINTQEQDYYTEYLGYTVAKNNGINIASNMVNLCYESAKYNNLKPYLCLGIGGDFIELFDVMRIKFAYQGKVGISYPITQRLVLSINGQYHKVIGNKFKFLPLIQPVPLRREQKSQVEQHVTALLTLDISYFSSDVGLSFMF